MVLINTTSRSNAVYVNACNELFSAWARNAQRNKPVAMRAKRALKCLHIEGSADQATTAEFAAHALKLGGLQ